MTTVIFDRFGKTDFENNIMSLTKTIPNVVSIYPEDSQRQVQKMKLYRHLIIKCSSLAEMAVFMVMFNDVVGST